jgi:hypothetical protein
MIADIIQIKQPVATLVRGFYVARRVAGHIDIRNILQGRTVSLFRSDFEGWVKGGQIEVLERDVVV